MDIEKITAFANLAASLTYQEAAAASEMTVTELKENVTELEQGLGLTLTIDCGETVQLTPAGQAILEQAKQIGSGWRQLQARIAECKEEAAHSAIKLAVLPSFDNYQASSVVAALAKSHHLEENEDVDPYQQLLDKTADIAFVRELDNVDLTKVETIPVDTDKIVAFIPARNPISQRSELTLTDLQAEKFLTLNSRLAIANYIQQVCDKAGLYLYSVFEGERGTTLVNMVALGMGVALLMEKSIGDHFDQNKVVKVAVEPTATCRLSFARLKDAAHSAAQDQFWQQLQKAFK